MIITSSSNDRIKEIKKLIKSARERRNQGLYVVEGIRMFREIPKEHMAEIYVSESQTERFAGELAQYSHIEPVIVQERIFNSVSDTESPQGILALVRIQEYGLPQLCGGEQASGAPFLFVIEHLQDPGNLGTIIRTAEACGVTGIILSADCVDIYNPKVIRSTMGSVFRMPVYVTDDLVCDIAGLKERGIFVYGTHLSGDAFYDRDFTAPCAFLIGNEGKGLSEAVSRTADSLIKIPMMGQVESLNAASSVAVVGYEVLRQRCCMKQREPKKIVM